MTRTFWIAIILLFPLAGCLEQDIGQTLYLEPDGTVTWQLIVTNHSPDEPDKAVAQYFDTLEGLETGEDPFFQLMEEMGATDLEVRILRDEPPLRYLLSARFASIDAVLEVLFEESEVTWDLWPSEEGMQLVFIVPETEHEEDMHPLDLIVTGGEAYRLERTADLSGLEIAWPQH